MTIVGKSSLGPGTESAVTRRCRALIIAGRLRVIRVMLLLFLLLITIFPLACSAPAQPHRAAQPPEPATAPAPTPTPVEQVWQGRPRSWDRLLVGLTRMPDRSYFTVKPEGPGRLIDGATRKLLARVGSGAPVMLLPGPGETVRFQGTGVAGTALWLRFETGGGRLRLEGRQHTGSLLCWRAGERLAFAIDAPIEAYLRGVLPGEVPSSWPLEAQKALAVAARTYAQASRGKHTTEGFDVCDGTHCQMYLGRVRGAARSELAVNQTQGLVALSGGRLIRAFYSADCGGRTANNEDVPFPDNPLEPQPYLRSVVDAPSPGGPHYCARSSHHRWSRLLTAPQVEKALNADPETVIGRLLDLRISRVDLSGRAHTIEVEGLMAPSGTAPQQQDLERHEGSEEARRQRGGPPTGDAPDILPSGIQAEPVTRTLPGYAFRRAIGPRWLKSTSFTLTRIDAGRYRLAGSGYGHGVGLCQIGARGMASLPYRRTFRQILRHYYRGVTIVRFRPANEPP